MRQDLLVGTWRLVSGRRRDERGRVYYPFGRRAEGLLIYGADGHMSVAIMGERRRKFKTAGSFRVGTPDEKIAAADSYFSYAGRFELRGKSVIHHLDVCLYPNWVGAREPRRIAELTKRRLTLETPPFDVDGRRHTARIVWERTKPKPPESQPRTISFTDDVIPKVLSGRKTETLRLDEPDFRKGEFLRVTRRDGRTAGRLRITHKAEIAFGRLKPQDAATHGWKSLPELKARLLEIYPGLKPSTVLTRYRFELAG